MGPKSITIDALFFLFGYRASKTGQVKLSELIHNLARYSDLDECSVEVHFRAIIELGTRFFNKKIMAQLMCISFIYG